MNATKVFIVVIVVLAVLFFVGAGAGFLSGDGEYDGTEEPWTEALGNIIASPRALRFDEVSTNCPLADPLPVAGTCRYTIAESGDAVRRWSLLLIQGSGAQVELRQPGSVTVRHTVRIGDAERERRKDLDVFKKGATLTIRCLSVGSPCRFDIRE